MWSANVRNMTYVFSKPADFEYAPKCNICTLKFLIEEHARLDFLSTLLEIFHVINEKFSLLVY